MRGNLHALADIKNTLKTTPADGDWCHTANTLIVDVAECTLEKPACLRQLILTPIYQDPPLIQGTVSRQRKGSPRTKRRFLRLLLPPESRG